MNSYTRRNIVRQTKKNKYTQKRTGRKPDPRMFYQRLSKSMYAPSVPSVPAVAYPEYGMSAIPEETSIQYAPYNRKGAFLASRRRKHIEQLLGRKLSAFNTRRFSKRPVPQMNDPMAAAQMEKRAAEREAKTRKEAQKRTKAKAAATAVASASAPTRRSSRLAAKETGAEAELVELKNTKRTRAPTKRKGPTKAEVENFSNMFSGMKF